VVLAGVGRLAPAVFPVVHAPGVVIDPAPGEAGDAALAPEAVEASARQLDAAPERTLTPRRDQIDSTAERVAPKQRAIALQDLDALDVLHGEEVKVDLRRIHFVHPDTVEEHRDALRYSHDRGGIEAARGEIQFVGAAEVVVDRDAGLLL